MTAPQLYRPWPFYGSASHTHLAPSFPGCCSLSLIFFTVVTPVAFQWRLAGRDGLDLQFKAARTSVMLQRNHRFAGADLEQPY